MAKKSEKEVLEVGVNVEKALQDMTKMERATKRNFSEVAKAVDKLNGVNKKATKQAEAGNDRWQSSLEDLTKAYKDEGKAIENVLETIDILTKKAFKQSKGEKKATLEEIDRLKKVGAIKIKNLRGKEGKEGRAMTSGMFKEAAKELGDTLKDTLSSVFSSKDVKGALENSAKALVKGLKLSAGAGLKINQAGSGLMAKGRDRGGMGGMALKGGGVALKTMGSLMGGIKPLIETLTKIGPILGTIGGAVIGLVKLFLDADSMVKDFNRDILEGASTTEFLGRAGGNADEAFTQLGDTLTGIRQAAQAFDNINWGISPDQYKAVIGVLKQEGVGLSRIDDEAARAGQSVQEFTTDLAHVSVAYSRAFGVPLQEINTLQAEMMTSMGADLKNVETSFEQMSKAAQDSGIEANKFFGMIRGVSQDLSLWGTRMEDAVKILGRLGKVMDPRNAQKFMQVAVQGLKNMGRTERLRATLLAGVPETKGIVDRSVRRKSDDLGKTLGMSGDDVFKKLKEGPAALEEAVNKLPKSMQGGIRDAISRLAMMQKSSGKGVFGVSSAAGDLDAGGALQVLRKALTRFSPGSKKLMDVVGDLAGEMMADNLGISEEQLKQSAQFELSIDSQRDMLKKLLTSGNEDDRKSARESLKQAKIEGRDDKDLLSKVDGLDYNQVLDTMTEDQAKASQGITDVRDFAKEQTELQTSMSTKLQMILDWLTNQLYDLLYGIYDTLLTVFGKGDDKRKAALGSRDLRDAVNATDSSKALVESTSWKDLISSLKVAANDPAQVNKVTDAVKAMADKIGPEATARALQDAGVSNDQLAEYRKNSGAVANNDGSMGSSGASNDSYAGKASEGLQGLNPGDLVKFMEKAVWWGNNLDRAEGIAAGKKVMGVGPSATPISASSNAPTVKPPGGGPAASPVPPTAPPELKEQTVAAQDTLSVTKEQASTMASIDNQMDKFKMDTSFLSGPYSKAVEGSVLKAVRTALFEYYMYKDLSPQTMIDTMRGGGYTPSTIGPSITDLSLRTGVSPSIAADVLKGHASGGLVTGVSDGLAQVTAAAGEGLALIGPGERIVPAGRGGGGSNPVNVTVNGVGGDDLRRIIEAKVIDGIHEYKRRERFH